MGRRPTLADSGVGPVIDLLAKTLKAKHIKFQKISLELGHSRTWLTGVIFRKRHFFLDDFLAICTIADIDPVEMLATDGFLKYVRNVPLMDIISNTVKEHLREEILGQDITLRVPRIRPKRGDDEPDGAGGEA